ncbi:hypothetical protein CDD82_1404 [Ophiocordyceps australis]|uniref:Uncharacterized protein n=1 Tax=Ophiocordyceps australis TaxID=1399860 RepID=A0A2C5ZGB2_9HYPO|nr:hypothetical protein CDD82_1404 [Ophiocordyceps australis]
MTQPLATSMYQQHWPYYSGYYYGHGIYSRLAVSTHKCRHVCMCQDKPVRPRTSSRPSNPVPKSSPGVKAECKRWKGALQHVQPPTRRRDRSTSPRLASPTWPKQPVGRLFCGLASLLSPTADLSPRFASPDTYPALVCFRSSDTDIVVHPAAQQPEPSASRPSVGRRGALGWSRLASALRPPRVSSSHCVLIAAN